MKRVIKKAQDVMPGDWYEEEEVIGVKNWEFAVDLRLRSGRVRMLSYDERVIVVTNVIEVILDS